MCLDEIRLVILGRLQCFMRYWVRAFGLFCSNFGRRSPHQARLTGLGCRTQTVVLEEWCCAFRQHSVLFVQRRRYCSLRWG